MSARRSSGVFSRIAPAATRTLANHSVAIVSAAIASLLTFSLPDATTKPLFLFSMLAAMVSTWRGGRWPGMVTSAICAGAIFYFMPVSFPALFVAPENRMLLTHFLGFILTSLLTVELVARLRRSQGEAVLHLRAKKTAEDALHLSQEELQQAYKIDALGRLAAGVAHDFNNLLNVIIGYTELQLKSLPEGDPGRRNSEGVRTAAETARTLTRQLLAFGRKRRPEPAVLDVSEVLAKVRPILEHLVRENIQLSVVPDLKPLLVKVDAGHLEQIIMNLVVNACDAMPNGGKLRIYSSDTVLDRGLISSQPALGSGRCVMLAVSDTGSGMDRATLAHIFDPFFTTKPKHRGTGLGLSIVRGIVQDAGGHIRVQSRLGSGTIFEIYLPAIEEASQAAIEVPPPIALGRGETILLVEDAAALRELTREFLAMRGYIVLDAANATEALAAAQKHQGPIHLLMTDVVMPGMSGWELAKILGPIRPEMKVLYASGHGEDMIAEGAPGLQAKLLQKPYTLDALDQAIRQLIDEPAEGASSLSSRFAETSAAVTAR